MISSIISFVVGTICGACVLMIVVIAIADKGGEK